MVKHLPKNMEGDLEQKIKDYFEKKTRELLPNEKRIEGEEVINRVNFIYDIDDLKECHDRQAQIILEIREIEKGNAKGKVNEEKEKRIRKEYEEL